MPKQLQISTFWSKTRKMAQLKADGEQYMIAVIELLSVVCNLLDKISFTDDYYRHIFNRKSGKCL
jgi:hypothetical protein